MSDLIKRQDAIDAIYEHEFSNWCDKDEVSTILYELPSAQPEVIACGEGELKSESQWIPVSERLPEENNFYLATIYSREVQTAFCDILFYGAPQLYEDRKIGWYFMYNGNMEQVFNVIAWMPLPEPYKEVEE